MTSIAKNHFFRSSPAERFWLILLVLLFVLSYSSLYAQDNAAQISIFLEKLTSPPDTTITFDRLVFLGAYESQELHLYNRSVRLADLSRQQMLLAESAVNPDDFHSLLIFLAPGSAAVVDSPANGRMITLPLNVSLSPGQAKALFLKWSVASPADSLGSGSFQIVRKEIPPLNALAFVSNEGSNNLTVMDRIAGEIVGVIRVGQEPRGLAISPRRNLLFVANAGSHTISVIELPSNLLRNTINMDFGDEPQALALSGDERLLFTANRGSNSVSIIDAFSLNRRDKVSVGSAPVDVAVDPNSGWVYTANSMSDDVTTFHPNSPESARNLRTGSLPVDLELNTNARALFVANYNSGTITQINTETFTVAATLNSTHSIAGIVSDSRASILYCSIEALDLVTTLKPSLNLDLASVPVGSSPTRVSLDPEGAMVYVICSESGNISLINRNTSRVKGSIATGLKPYMVVFP